MDILKNQWVDKYLLRYGPATILGSFILAYFYSRRAKYGIVWSISGDRLVDVPLFVGGGFLYAYVASAPILVFHYSRPFFAPAKIPKWRTFGSILLLGTIFAIFACHFEGKLGSWVDGIWAATAFTFGVTIWLYALLAFCFRRVVFNFYKALCLKRNRDRSGMVESYRTLREHGNAFQIMVWEGVLAFVILALLNLNGVRDSDDLFFYGVCLLFIWLGPAALAWSVASRLEADFVDES